MKSMKLKVLLSGLVVIGLAYTLGLGKTQAQQAQVYQRALVTCVGYGGIVHENGERWEDVRVEMVGHLIRITGRIGFKNTESYCATAQVKER